MSMKIKAITDYRVAVVLFVLVALGGLGYNVLMIYIDEQAYAQGVAALAAQAAAPTTYRTIVQGDSIQYEKCERGFCWSAPDEESLKQVMTSKNGSSGGFQTIDSAAFQQFINQTQTGS